jgi:Zn finger protein HypA/HybF involved in hydrogenase expression
MTPERCDLTELRSLAMKKAQEKRRELQKHGIPISGETFGDLFKASYEEAKAECNAASDELTEEQMAKLREICPPCAERFRIKKPESNL